MLSKISEGILGTARLITLVVRQPSKSGGQPGFDCRAMEICHSLRAAIRAAAIPKTSLAQQIRAHPPRNFLAAPLIWDSRREISTKGSSRAPPSAAAAVAEAPSAREAPRNASPASPAPTSSSTSASSLFPFREAWAKRQSASPSRDSILKDQSSSSVPELADFDAASFEDKYGLSRNTEKRMRLVPSAGRTIHVSGHVDVARSFRLLDRLMKQNRVKQDVQMQRFHERPGLKRKRLRRERWAKRFKFSFVSTVKRVQELRKQGW